MNPKLVRANDGINIVYNFFDFLTILFNRNMQPNTTSTLRAALDLCNRHATPLKKIGLQIF